MRLLRSAALLALLAATPLHAEGALKTALDGNAPPYAMPKMDGTVEGMSVDMTREIARRMGRDIDVQAMAFSALVPALQAGSFDYLSVPFGVTQERSEAFLLTEGIWSSKTTFLIAAKGGQVASLEDLRGKVIATNKGNTDDKWARELADAQGWKVESYGSLNDAAQAVQAGRADAAAVNEVTGYTLVKRAPNLRVAELRIDRGAYFTYALPKGAEALRHQVEDAIECIKADGTAAKIYAKWVGVAPAPGSLEVTPQPGYGPVGFANVETAEHPLACK